MKLVNFWMDDNLKQELDILSKRERRSLKDILNEQIANYVKEHGDGNPNFTLDQFDQEEMRAIPAVGRDEQHWKDYLNKIDDKRADEDMRKLEKLALLARYRVDHGDANVRVI